MRELTIPEIQKLTNRKGVRKIAVENFLITLTNNPNVECARANLYMDAELYHWNYVTINAILAGIRLANKR